MKVVIVVGAPGTDEYGQDFQTWAQTLQQACQKGAAEAVRIGPSSPKNPHDREQLQALLQKETKQSAAPLWLVFLGHGTFDGRSAKFNLEGPDLTAAELAGWLKPFDRPLAVINCASSSGPFLPKLSATNRVVITATKSGYEQNYTRFGRYFSQAFLSSPSDLDQDRQVSLLEAFLFASHQVGEYYKTEGRLATEHALLDDNGDGLGTPADWFRGIQATKKPDPDSSGLDGLRAHQFHLIPSPLERQMSPEMRNRRDELELDIAELRQSKTDLAEEEYYDRLEELLLELARLYQKTEQQEQQQDPPKHPEQETNSAEANR